MNKEKTRKIWKYMTIIMALMGIMFLIISSVTAFPPIRSVDSTDDMTRTYEVKDIALKATMFTDFDPDEIDQEQISLDSGYKIGRGLGGTLVLQTVVNDREPMIGFVVAIARHGSPSDPLYMGIMYPDFGHPYDGQNYMIAGSVEVADVPLEDHYSWYGIDFSDYPKDIPSGLPLGIVLFSTEDVDGDHWLWGCSSGNPYPGYQPAGWNFMVNEWQEGIMVDGDDMCFTTFTPGGNDSEMPEITITTTSWVTTGLGIFNLIGALFSGTRYLGWI